MSTPPETDTHDTDSRLVEALDDVSTDAGQAHDRGTCCSRALVAGNSGDATHAIIAAHQQVVDVPTRCRTARTNGPTVACSSATPDLDPGPPGGPEHDTWSHTGAHGTIDVGPSGDHLWITRGGTGLECDLEEARWLIAALRAAVTAADEAAAAGERPIERT
ncbi:MAG: hypothetical protein ABS81_08150 [Pseudonocardia sp. SCN 72-86]|nr:MAG: hypothetical protein ABS81_08150 [Pseudonocardia sp. SCN 72-86]